jgi:predicted transcriptional regulator
MKQPKTRKTVYFDDELEKIVQEMADKRNWSFSYMSYVLLQQAVKEKTRKSKTGKENNTEHHSTDLR